MVSILLTAAGSAAASADRGSACEPQWVPTFGGVAGLDTPAGALAVFDDGGGPALYVGGDFITAGGETVNHIAKWDGASWSPLGEGTNGEVLALTVFDDGSGPALYAGGIFTTAGGVPAKRVAKWDGKAWTTLGEGVDGVSSFWVYDFAVFDDGTGPALFVGGNFDTAGGLPANSIARWDGKSWSPVGGGVSGGTGGEVRALMVFNDGTGPALYAGGSFTIAGDTTVNRIAKWDGKAWSPLAGGMNERVRALTVFDDGSGRALYAGGDFIQAGGVLANRVAKWDGAVWSPLGAGTNRAIGAFTEFNDGAGPALFVGGSFDLAGGLSANCVAKWDGNEWSPLGSGITGYVADLAEFDGALFVGGFFTFAGGLPAGRIAMWQGCASTTPCPGDTNGDNIVNFTDLNAVLTAFGQNVAPGTGADLNGDGVVNFTDLNAVLSNFGDACP